MRYGLITMLELKMLTIIKKINIVREQLFLQRLINELSGSGRYGDETGPIK